MVSEESLKLLNAFSLLIYFVGLPCRLTQFEIQLLLEEGLAVLMDKSVIVQKSLPKNIIEEHETVVNDNLEEQLSLCREDKIKEQMHYLHKIVDGKKNKLRRMGVPEEGRSFIKPNSFQN